MENSDIDIIKKMYVDLCDASINKDIDKIKQLLAEDYVLVHMTGMNQTRSDYINSVINGELKYYESIHESIEVNIRGNVAFVVGKTKTLASPFGMPKSWWRLKQEMTLEKRNDKWVITHSKASTY